MTIFRLQRVGRWPLIAVATRLACAFAAVNVHAQDVKQPEVPRSRILYFEESGGIISAATKPMPNGIREPIPPIPAPDGKARNTPQITIAGKPPNKKPPPKNIR